MLDARIRDTLDLSPSDVTALSYETDAQNKCARLLLLMNVETVRRVEHSTERYSFRLHREGAWSLEHIHAQQAESLNEASSGRSGCDCTARRSRTSLPSTERGVTPSSPRSTRPRTRSTGKASRIWREMSRRSSRSRTRSARRGALDLQPGAAVERRQQRAGNAVFEVKRRRILELDRTGRVHPDLHAPSVPQVLHGRGGSADPLLGRTGPRELSRGDLSGAGVVVPYLKPEDRQS